VVVNEVISGTVTPLGDLIAPNKTFEDYFIDKDYEGAIGSTQKMRVTVDAFKASVTAIPNDASAVASLQALINTEAPKILARGRALCSQNSRAYADDRILYWARIAMVVALKSHPALMTRFSDRATLVKSLEEKSRGLTTATFAGAPSGAKKLLITGFDPFSLNPDPQLGNIYQSNPSGAIALALHGQTLPGNVYVQSAMLPVRYSAFDQNPDGTGVVEDFYTRFLDSSAVGYEAVDMIMTVSQGSPMRFDVDRFAVRWRSGGKDNENRPMSVPPKFKIRDTTLGDKFYVTQLPVIKMVVPTTLHPFFLNAFNQMFAYRAGSTKYSYKLQPNFANSVAMEQFISLFTEDGTWSGVPITEKVEGRADADIARGLGGKYVPSELSEFTSPKLSMVSITEGSGGAYLSNESFYRVSRLRAIHAPTLQTGHYHVPLIQTRFLSTISNWSEFLGLTGDDRLTVDFNPALTKKLIDRAEEGMSNALT
jgi:hypothetical protein